MALSIKSDTADRLARELAAQTGESLTDAVTAALAERLERERRRARPSLGDRLRRLQSDVAALEVRDGRSAEDIIDYGESGAPA